MNVLILLIIGLVVLAFIAHVASTIAFLYRVRGNDRSPPLPSAQFVSVVRPVRGLDNWARETLESSFVLDHPNYEVLFCVADQGDPAIPLLKMLVKAHPNVSARILTGNNPISENPKLNNIVKGWRAAKGQWIVMADSNVLMPPDYLAQLFSRWDARTGLVCSPPIGGSPEGLWAEVECAFLNGYQARWQCFADSMGYGFAQGKSMLWRKEFLEANGGIGALAGELAEDAAATKLVRKSGLKVRLVARPFEQPLGWRTAADVWSRQIRWARLRRDTFQLLFLPELFSGGATPLLLLTIATWLLGGPVLTVTLGFGFAWYALEAILAKAARWNLSWRSPAAWIIRDVLLPPLWIASWMGNSFDWRGNSMTISGDDHPAVCH